MRGRLAFLLALALGAGACVPDIGEAPETSRAPEADPAARTGGTLRLAIERPGSLDPTLAVDPQAQLVVRTMCDGLLATDPTTGEPAPALAHSWTVADGGRALFLRLRRDARFPSGTPLTSDAVAVSLSRLAAEDTASPLAHLMRPVAGYAFVHGDAEPPDERMRRRLLGVTPIDPHSLQITLERPFADFVRTLTHPATVPTDPATGECAGPYRAVRPWEGRGTITLERVPDAIAADTTLALGGGGFADRIVLRTTASRTAAWRLARAGTVHAAAVPEARLRAARRGPGSLVEAATALVEYVGLPTTTAPFDDARVRVALSRLLDRARIARRVYGGGRVPADSHVAPAVPGRWSCGDRAPVRPDPDAAAVLEGLRGTRVPLFFNAEGRNRALAEEIARAWNRAGLDVRPTGMTWERLRAAATRASGIGGAFRFAWKPDFPSPDRVVAPLFLPAGIGQDNWSSYGTAALDDALDDARRAVDAADRERAYRRVAILLCEEMPMIPVVTDVTAYLVRDDRIVAGGGRWTDRATASLLLRELALRR